MWDSFKGRQVLITGDTGFKGSWLAFWLARLGAEVHGLALPPEGEAPLFTALGLDSRISHTDQDIRDLDGVLKVFDRAAPEVVFHLAAQALVRRSYEDPKTTFDTNLGGSVNLLEAVRRTPSVRALVYITSDKCYRNKEWVWGYRESDELGGHDPYSASKAAAEIAFSSYRDSFLAQRPGLAAASARAGNVVGGGDRAADRIVPDCIRALERGAPIVLRNPDATRPWQHVLEPLSGYLTLAARMQTDAASVDGSWNFGPDIGTASCTVGTLAGRIAEYWGGGDIRVERPDDAPHEARLLFLNTDKARIDLDWRPAWDLERTLAETVGWYRAVHDGADPAEVTGAQIDAYMSDWEKDPTP